MKNSLVSVITPTHNSLLYIEETLRSIIKQTYTNWELLVTDDLSSDGTFELLNSYAKKDPRIFLFRLEKNSGPGVARNNSLRHAKGRYIAFCDSDDIWYPDKLDKQIRFLNNNDLAFTYSAYEKMNAQGEKIGIINVPPVLTYNMLLKTCPIGCLTAIYDTEKLGKVYMPHTRKRQDYGLWLKIFNEIGASMGMNEILASYRVRHGSVSSNKFLAAKYHFIVLRSATKISRFKAYYYFLYYALRGVFKYLK